MKRSLHPCIYQCITHSSPNSVWIHTLPKGLTCSQPTPQHTITTTLLVINRSKQLIEIVIVKQPPKEAINCIFRETLKFFLIYFLGCYEIMAFFNTS
jgi:hypothetical protein